MGLIRHALLVSLIAICTATPALAQTCLDYTQHIRWESKVGSICHGYGDTGGYADCVAAGNVVYAAFSGCGLEVLDFSDPSAPTVAAAIPTGDGAYGLALAAPYLYVAAKPVSPDTRGLLFVYDISSPLAPAYVGQLELNEGLPYFYCDLVAYAGHVYVQASGGAGDVVEVVDVTDPALPVSVVSVPAAGLRGLARTGDLLLLATDVGLEVLDLVDPSAPAPLGSLPLTGMSAGLAARGNLAYVAAGGFRVVDLTIPSAPVQVGIAAGIDGALGINLSDDGSRAFAVMGDAWARWMQVVHIADPTDPSLGGAFDPVSYGFGRVSCVASAGERVFVGEWTSMEWQSPAVAVHALDVSFPSSPSPLGALTDSTVSIDAVTVQDDWIYASYSARDGSREGLLVVDASDPGVPALADTALTGTYLPYLAAADDLLLGAEWAYPVSVLGVVDIQNPAAPTRLGGVALPDLASGIAFNGGHAFVSCRNGVTYVVDVSSPAVPQIVGSATTGEWADAVAIKGQHLLVMADGLYVFDIGDPTSPVQVGHLPVTGWGYDMAVAGDHVYVPICWPDRFVVLDVADPTNPTLVASVAVPGPNVTVEAIGPTVYLGGRMGLTVFDVGDPTQPAYLGSWADNFSGSAMARGAGYVILGGWSELRSEPLVLMPLDCTVSGVPLASPLGTRLINVYPNPFNPQTTVSLRVDRTQRATVSVYDVAGRRVRVLADRVFEEGPHELSWNGRDGSGRAAASGMYLIRLEGETGTDLNKAVLVR